MSITRLYVLSFEKQRENADNQACKNNNTQLFYSRKVTLSK